MKQPLEMMEFGVTGLAEVRTLAKRWKKVVAGLAGEDGPSLVWKTRRRVGVEVEDRRPGQGVLLTFLAPKEVCPKLRENYFSRKLVLSCL